uniref:Uncharacterized protein n=1 Tax=Trichinella nativa TaxID=6335 RepID=A0A0V1KID0_9BILA
MIQPCSLQYWRTSSLSTLARRSLIASGAGFSSRLILIGLNLGGPWNSASIVLPIADLLLYSLMSSETTWAASFEVCGVVFRA